MLDFITTLWAWMEDNRVVLAALTAASLVMFVGSLVVVPIFLAKVPPTFFTQRYERTVGRRMRAVHPGRRVLGLVLRNVGGVVLILAGLPMLIGPGQGIIAIVLGLMLLSIPGKRRAARWLLRLPGVRHAVAAIRRRAGRPPLVLDETDANPGNKFPGRR